MSAVAGRQQYDGAGDPICTACEQPVHTIEGFARVDFRMLHVRCWTEMPEHAPPR